MPDRTTIVDASTLIGLLNVDKLWVLEQLYSRITITSIIEDEVGVSLPEWVEINNQYNKDTYQSMTLFLEEGEASSIALALKIKECLLVVDERKGRKHAKQLGLKITGLTGIIIKAKKQGYIESGKEILDDLINQGFRLSDKIYRFAIDQMNEE
jgi:predicted nucleic acid-binding protein